MKKLASILLVISMFGPMLMAQDLTSRFDAAKMRDRVKTLSADDMEGRGPGTAGGSRAAKYIADQMRSNGVMPGNGSSYFQDVKLIGVKADPDTTLYASGSGKDGTSFKFADDFVATTGAQTADVEVSSHIIFVGYGINAPEYKWNDYKGDPERYKGKWLMILVNDPPATSNEPDLFGGKALTYYGRWTYKYEEAARHGAAGVILVHTDRSAGYGWNVVRSSNSSWKYEIERSAGDKTPFLKVKAWMTESASARLLASSAKDLKKLQAAATKRDFEPEELTTDVTLKLHSKFEHVRSPNVVGIVKGSDKKLSNEYVVYSAHYDHLGIGEPDATGDKIYNGAYDNASGVASVLGVAEMFAKMPKNKRPKRSFLFLITTAEEQGLLGAEYYSQNPIIPLNKTAADINLDGVNFFGKVSDFVPLGADRSSLIDPINAAAQERNFELIGDMSPEQGFFFRSDHFPFAKVGVPSVNFEHGDKFLKPLTGEPYKFFMNYTAEHYHQASDEYHDWWDIDAMIQETEFAAAIGIKVADLSQMPHYKDMDEFSAADKARFK